MKNNRGEITLEEMLKIILAIMGIIILGILVLKLYDIFVSGDKHQLEQAKMSLAKISSGIDELIKNNLKQKDIIVESPNGWKILAWPKENIVNEKGKSMPEDCKLNCICICKTEDVFYTSSYIENCNNLGVCSEVSLPVKTFTSYKITTTKSGSSLPTDINNPYSLETADLVTTKVEGAEGAINIDGPIGINITLNNGEIYLGKKTTK